MQTVPLSRKKFHSHSEDIASTRCLYISRHSIQSFMCTIQALNEFIQPSSQAMEIKETWRVSIQLYPFSAFPVSQTGPRIAIDNRFLDFLLHRNAFETGANPSVPSHDHYTVENYSIMHSDKQRKDPGPMIYERMELCRFYRIAHTTRSIIFVSRFPFQGKPQWRLSLENASLRARGTLEPSRKVFDRSEIWILRYGSKAVDYQ